MPLNIKNTSASDRMLFMIETNKWSLFSVKPNVEIVAAGDTATVQGSTICCSLRGCC